jgi:hypothetical protein
MTKAPRIGMMIHHGKGWEHATVADQDGQGGEDEYTFGFCHPTREEVAILRQARRGVVNKLLNSDTSSGARAATATRWRGIRCQRGASWDAVQESPQLDSLRPKLSGR